MPDRRKVMVTDLGSRGRHGLLVLLVAGMALALPAAAVAAPPDDRPAIGLVLSGGGARGAAHVGVLKVLEELRVPVDYIAGTSMGSIVGGLYAAGLTPEQIAREMEGMDWGAVFDDRTPRPERSFRRKRDDDLYLVRYKLGYEAGEAEIPLAPIEGQQFDIQLGRLTRHVEPLHNFDRLAIPYRAVAADLETGREVVLGSGELSQAIRASMAVPGAFAPVEIDGRLLVDGGIANNLPMDVARAMGADILIVVDISGELLGKEDFSSVLSVLDQMTTIMTRRNVDAQLATLRTTDVYIDAKAALGDIGSASFDRVAEGMVAGEQAARAMAPALQRLALSAEEYQRHLAARPRFSDEGPPIAFLRIDNQSRVSDQVIAARLEDVKPGEPLDTARLNAAIADLYGLDLFENVRYELVEEGGETGVVVHVQEKSWGPNFIQTGVSISDDLDGDNRFNLGISYLRTAINELNGEWRVAAQIGEEPAIGTEIYQPLDPAGRYFVSADLAYRQRQFRRYDGDEVTSELQVSGGGVDLAAGRNLGNWGELRVGWRRISGTIDVQIGDPASPDDDFDSGEAYLGFAVDTIDDAHFPRHGIFLASEYRVADEDLGADTDFAQAELRGVYARTWGRGTLLLGGRLGFTLDDEAPVQGRFRSGGFFNLSGLQQNQLSGQHVTLLRSGYYHRVNDFKWLPAYLGGSLELGNVWQDDGDIAYDDMIWAGSLFLGLDTVLGPLYTGYGLAEGGEGSAFLFLGRLF